MGQTLSCSFQLAVMTATCELWGVMVTLNRYMDTNIPAIMQIRMK